GEGVVVEEKLLHLRKPALREPNFLDDMTDAAHPVAVPADRLRPQAKGTFRPAAAPGIERYIRVPQIADEVILDPEVPPVQLVDEGQLVHVLEDRTVGIVDDDTVGVAEALTVD